MYNPHPHPQQQLPGHIAPPTVAYNNPYYHHMQQQSLFPTNPLTGGLSDGDKSKGDSSGEEGHDHTDSADV